MQRQLSLLSFMHLVLEISEEHNYINLVISNIVTNTLLQRTQEKSEMVTDKDTTQVARNM